MTQYRDIDKELKNRGWIIGFEVVLGIERNTKRLYQNNKVPSLKIVTCSLRKEWLMYGPVALIDYGTDFNKLLKIIDKEK